MLIPNMDLELPTKPHSGSRLASHVNKVKEHMKQEQQTMMGLNLGEGYTGIHFIISSTFEFMRNFP